MTFSVSLSSPRGLNSEAVSDLLDAMRAGETSRGWLLREPDGEPWCVVLGGHDRALRTLDFEVSFASPNLLRNAANAMDLAVKFAAILGAEVAEDLTGEEVSENKLDLLLDPSSDFTNALVRAWQGARDQLTTQLFAPLEAPVAGDYTKEYFLFLLEKPGIEPTLDLLGAKANEFEIRSNATNVVLMDPKVGEPVVQIISLPDNETVLVRPYWSMLPFSQLATRTLEIALHMGGRANVVPTHAGFPVEGARLQAIQDRSRGWGMDYFLWLASGGLS